MSQTLLNSDNSSALLTISQKQYLELKMQMDKVFLEHQEITQHLRNIQQRREGILVGEEFIQQSEEQRIYGWFGGLLKLYAAVKAWCNQLYLAAEQQLSALEQASQQEAEMPAPDVTTSDQTKDPTLQEIKKLITKAKQLMTELELMMTLAEQLMLPKTQIKRTLDEEELAPANKQGSSIEALRFAGPIQAVAKLAAEIAQSNDATGASSHSFWQRNSSLVGVAGVTLGPTVGAYCALVLAGVITGAAAISAAFAIAGLTLAAIFLLAGIAALINHFSKSKSTQLDNVDDGLTSTPA